MSRATPRPDRARDRHRCRHPEDQRDRLFTKFARLDGSSTRQAGGSGLGRGDYKTLTELMGGAITFSAPAEGACPSPLSVPMAKAAPAPSLDIAAPELEDKWKRRGFWWMKRQPDEPRRAADPAEPSGRRRPLRRGRPRRGGDVETDRWDAILMDVHMPVMDGVEASKAIREERPSAGQAGLAHRSSP